MAPACCDGGVMSSRTSCIAQPTPKTPMPFIYVVMIKQLIMVYLLTLPFAVGNISGWWSPPLMAIISPGRPIKRLM